MQPIVRALVLAALLGLGLTAVSVQAEQAAKPMIVKIHADWCGTCVRLNSTMAALEEEVGDDAVIVVLDVTDRNAVTASAAEADRLGIDAFFDAYKAKTGTVGVLTANGETVVVLKGEFGTEKYLAAVKRAGDV